MPVAARTAPPAASGISRAGELPPWELADGELAAAPVPEDLALPVSNTGPMYVWNPAASGPLPILEEEPVLDKEPVLGGDEPES
jgi:hypothetical protein